jgi:hypothetical protein
MQQPPKNPPRPWRSPTPRERPYRPARQSWRRRRLMRAGFTGREDDAWLVKLFRRQHRSEL